MRRTHGLAEGLTVGLHYPEWAVKIHAKLLQGGSDAEAKGLPGRRRGGPNPVQRWSQQLTGSTLTSTAAGRWPIHGGEDSGTRRHTATGTGCWSGGGSPEQMAWTRAQRGSLRHRRDLFYTGRRPTTIASTRGQRGCQVLEFLGGAPLCRRHAGLQGGPAYGPDLTSTRISPGQPGNGDCPYSQVPSGLRLLGLGREHACPRPALPSRSLRGFVA
jgi:hypothetical protein